MKGDFSRNTFNPGRNYSRVLMQQGRVQLDSDFNEQTAIIIDSMRKLAVDLNGNGWGPSDPIITSSDRRGGFAVTLDKSKKTITFRNGRYYVNGIACETDGFKMDYSIDDSKIYIIYFDVWERHITFIQNDFVREVALNGPDTCSRAEIVWKIRIEDVKEIEMIKGRETYYPSEITELYTLLEYLNVLQEKLSALKVQLTKNTSINDVCSLSPESRYRGQENQLYRFEIHKKGFAWNKITDENGNPVGNANEAATFKWSRDNGSVVFPIKYLQGNIVTLGNLGRDERSSLKVGDWVEIIDDVKELDGKAGVMAQVEKIDTIKMMVTLKYPSEILSTGLPSYENNATTHPLLRRWDHRAKTGVAMYAGAILIKENEPIEIEDGIEVIFTKDKNNVTYYHTGDYWSTCARITTGNIEWPMDDSGKVPKALPPFGIQHYYAPLAIVKNGTIAVDCRCIKEPCCKPKDI
jgi:hypothetical protein